MGERYCKNGKVILVRVPWGAVRRPSSAEVLIDDGDRQSDYANQSLFLAIDGSVLWASSLSCGHCRARMGFAWVLDLDELDPAAGQLHLEHIFSRPLVHPINAKINGREGWLKFIKAELSQYTPRNKPRSKPRTTP